MRCSLFIMVCRKFIKIFPVSNCLLFNLILYPRIKIGLGEEHQSLDPEVSGSPLALSSFSFLPFDNWRIYFKSWRKATTNFVQKHQIFELKDTNVEDYSSNFELSNSKIWSNFIKFAEFTSWFDATSKFLEWSLSHH